jgi:RNA polymerase sigma-70 factor, ECF subfamily
MQTQRIEAVFPSKPVEDGRPADAELVARCRAGDPDAFRDIYQRHATRLYNVAWRMSGSPADAEELVQEIFLLAYRKLDTFKGESALGTWLYRLAINLCLDRLRSKQGRRDQMTEPLVDGEGQTADDPGTAPLDVVSRIDLERAIERLPDRYRAAFLLHDVEGLDHREVGNVMGIAEGTSKSLVHKARRQLRALLGGRPGETR